MGRLIFSIGLVVIGIGIGYIIRILNDKKGWGLSMDLIRRRLQQSALLFFNPIAILGATWVAGIHDLKIAAMPVMGLAALLSGGLMAWAAAKPLQLSRKQTGSFIVCGGFTNIGSLGALFCFIFLGEKGFALVPFYKLFEEAVYYAVGFPIAKSYSDDLSATPSFGARLKGAVTDKFVVVAVGSIAAGLILNLSGIPRPAGYAHINVFCVPFAALLLLVSIGMAMRFSSVASYFKPGLVITAIKFVMVPCMMLGLGLLMGLGSMDNGLALKVVLILSAMPVGFIAMVPPTIYKLDTDLSNACWLMTNGGLVVVVPILGFVIDLF